jgi:hypothetical protein
MLVFRWQTAAIAVLALIAGGAGLVGLRHAVRPDQGLVNGTYVNTCCAAFVLRDGQLVHGSDRTSYRLLNMKFGLAAYLPGVVTISGIHPASEETVLLFHGDNIGRGFRAVIQGQEFEFQRADAVPAVPTVPGGRP